MNAANCRAKIRVSGRVQGVGYRWSAQKMANELGLTGFAKNLPDESVYIEAQGSPDSVNTLIEWCRKGPPRAIVDSVEYTFHPLLEYENFQIR